MRWLLVGVLRAYRAVVSPLYGPVCRYHPSCSSYALAAVTRFGAVRGTWMAVRRVLRCNPWSFGGYDPVPGTDPGHDAATAADRVTGGSPAHRSDHPSHRRRRHRPRRDGVVRDDGDRGSGHSEQEAVRTTAGELSTTASHREAHP